MKRPLFCSHFQKSIMSRTVKSIITSKKCFCLPDNDRFQKVQSSLCNYPDALLRAFFFLQKQKCLMIIFTIASQTLEASYYCWLVYARGLKWPHLLFFFRFWLIDWKTVRKGRRGPPIPKKIYVSGNFWTINQTKNVKWGPLLSRSIHEFGELQRSSS